jgi:hypothetical protein
MLFAFPYTPLKEPPKQKGRALQIFFLGFKIYFIIKFKTEYPNPQIPYHRMVPAHMLNNTSIFPIQLSPWITSYSNNSSWFTNDSHVHNNSKRKKNLIRRERKRCWLVLRSDLIITELLDQLGARDHGSVNACRSAPSSALPEFHGVLLIAR